MNVTTRPLEGHQIHIHKGGSSGRGAGGARVAGPGRGGRRIGAWTGAGSSGSTGAARSPTWWPGGRTARSSLTSCCRRTPGGTPTRPSPAIRHLLGFAAGRADSRPSGSRRSGWAPPWPPMPCSSARASRPCSSSPAASRDALRIAYQNRPRLFDRQIVLPELLYSRVIEADERVGAHGEVIAALDEEAVAAALRAAYGDGFRVGGGRVPARLPLPGARAADRRDRPRGSASPRCRSPTRPAR